MQYARPRTGEVEMAHHGVVRRDDGRLYSLNEERYLAEEELTGDAEALGVFRSCRGGEG